MKRVLSIIAALGAASALSAQEYLHINSHWYEDFIPVEQIDSITYGEASHSHKLPAIMAADPNISIFNEALLLTHMCDSLLDVYDFGFVYEQDITQGIYWEYLASAMTKVRKGYTAFVETDQVYAAHGINNISDLKAYAAKVYDEMYPEDAGITDPTDRRNSLNRFVSYHLLDRMGHKGNLTAAGINNNRAGQVANKYNRNKVDIADWYETMMPHSLLKCSSPLLSTGETVFINRRGLCDVVEVEGVEINNASGMDYQGVAENGYYHYIDGIIAYDKQTQQVVLDEQIIVNNSTISPEFMNNDMRISSPYAMGSNIGEIYIPQGALKNMQFNNDQTRLFYLFDKNWNNVQTDEMLLMGPFDITIKLPSVPAGTYELNLGYGTSSARHIVAMYLNEEFCDTLDQRIMPYSEEIGWVEDAQLGTPEAIAENDRLLFSHGYRKGLDYCYSYSGTQSMRDNVSSIRRIITSFTTDGKTDYYLRLKNINLHDDGSAQFHFDFLELCPTHLLNEYK